LNEENEYVLVTGSKLIINDKKLFIFKNLTQFFFDFNGTLKSYSACRDLKFPDVATILNVIHYFPDNFDGFINAQVYAKKVKEFRQLIKMLISKQLKKPFGEISRLNEHYQVAEKINL
jgi:hypothetical protein